MIDYVKKPNLPNHCNCLLIGDRYKRLFIQKFNDLNIRPIGLPSNYNLHPAISGHCDLSFLHINKNILLCDADVTEETIDTLKELGLIINKIHEKSGKAYPYDVYLNACVIGDKVFLNPKSASKRVLECIEEMELSIIPVKQGYTKCSICIVTENSIITADEGIKEAAEQNGIEALFIPPGNIVLHGFNYGFIGGSAFKISKNKLCFTGKLDHFLENDIKRIYDFLNEKEIEPVFLTNRPIFDIGGAIPITESP